MRFRISLLAVPMAVLCVLPARAMTEDQLAMNITSLHTRIYGLDNLLVKPYEVTPRNDVDDWRGLMKAVRTFVEGKTKDRLLLEALKDMEEASEMLITERQGGWNICIRKCITGNNPEAGLSRLDPSRIRFTDLKLAYVREGNFKLQNLRRRMTLVTDRISPGQYPAAPKEAAARIIKRLGLTLDTTITKYGNDLIALDKEQRAKTGNRQA